MLWFFEKIKKKKIDKPLQLDSSREKKEKGLNK